MIKTGAQHLKAKSPAKLILSGEHAVVHGAPAIAMAVNRYAEITIAKHFSPAIFFNFLNLRYTKSLTQQALGVL
jgi:mevalonate kinase